MKKLISLLLLILALLQYRLWLGDSNIKEFQRLKERIEELKQESLKRRERNASLEAEVMDLKQGLDAIEERARQDLGMIKQGETFVQVFSPIQEDKPQTKPKTLVKPRPHAPTKPAEDNRAPEAVQKEALAPEEER